MLLSPFLPFCLPSFKKKKHFPLSHGFRKKHQTLTIHVSRGISKNTSQAPQTCKPWSQNPICPLCKSNLSSCCCLVTQLCPTLWGPMDCSPPGSSVHEISQARILQWVAFSFSRGSSWSKHRTCISYTGRWILYPWVTREAPNLG